MRIELFVPKGWRELTDDRLRYVFRLMTSSYDAATIKTLCLLRWNGVKVEGKQQDGCYILRHGKSIFEVRALALAELLQNLDWMDSLPLVPIRLESIGGRDALPADFQGVPFENYIIVDNLYQGYLQTQNDELLDDIAQLMYGGRVKMKPEERVSIFYWMASLKEFFSKKFSDFLQQSASTDLLGFQKQSVEDAMNAQIRALTKGDITKEKEILAMDTWRALAELNAQAREYKDLTEKYGHK